MRMANRNFSNRRGRMLSWVVLAIGVAGSGVLWYMLSGVDELAALFLAGFVSAAVVTGLAWFGRVRARERWEAAWDSYAAREVTRRPLATVEEERTFSLAGTR